MIIAPCNSSHPPLVEYHGSAIPFVAWHPLTFSFDAWRFIDSWLPPRASYLILRGGCALSRPSLRCPWSSAWQSSSTPSTILPRRINTKPIRAAGRHGGLFLGFGRRLQVAATLGDLTSGWPIVLVPHPSAHQLPHTCAFFYCHLADRRDRRHLPAQAQAKAGHISLPRLPPAWAA